MKANPQILGLATNINITDLFNEINDKRTENGLGMLHLDEELSTAARAKALDMFSKGYWAHFAPDGTTPWFFIEKVGYKYKYAGENLAKDFADSSQVVMAWMNSETHKKNILDQRFKDVGLAVVNGKLNEEETTLVVQLFGTRSKTNAQVSTVATETPVSIIKNKQTFVSVTPASTLGSSSMFNDLSTVSAYAIGNQNTTMVSNPTFNVFSLTKKLSIALGLFLMILLYIDAAIIFKKKIYRISGNNIAHIVFLLFLMMALYWTRYGAIV